MAEAIDIPEHGSLLPRPIEASDALEGITRRLTVCLATEILQRPLIVALPLFLYLHIHRPRAFAGDIGVEGMNVRGIFPKLPVNVLWELAAIGPEPVKRLCISL